MGIPTPLGLGCVAEFERIQFLLIAKFVRI